MILYFSATGNGKYISEQIVKKTDETSMSIVDCILWRKKFKILKKGTK